MKAIPYHVGRLALVLGIFASCLITLKLSVHGFSGYDVSPMIDAGWRVLCGQVPGKDFVITFPASLYLATALSFRFLGVTWRAITLGECFLYAVVSLLGMRVASLLREVLGRRDTLFLTSGFVAAQTILILSVNYLWHSSMAESFAIYAVLATAALVLIPLRSRLVSVELWGHLLLAFTCLVLCKPNTAFPTMVLCILVLVRAGVGTRWIASAGLASIGLAAVILGRVHVSLPAMLGAYVGLTGRLIPKAFFNGILYTLYARYGLANLVVYLVIGFTSIALWKAAWQKRDAVLATPQLLLAIGSMVVAILGMGTNFDFKLTDTPLFVFGFLLCVLTSPRSLAFPSFRRDASLCIVFLVLLSAYFGITRFRMQIVGTWADDKARDLTKFDDIFFGHFAGRGIMAETLHEIDVTMGSFPPGSRVFFGPELEFEYARNRMQSPLNLPNWWDPGTSYPLSKEQAVTDAWKRDHFDVLIFNRGAELILPLRIRDEMASKYVLVPRTGLTNLYVRRTPEHELQQP